MGETVIEGILAIVSIFGLGVLYCLIRAIWSKITGSDVLFI